VYVALLYGVSASVLGLQSQEFVAGGLSGQTRLTNLGTNFVPDFQGALRFFKQPLIFATDRCHAGELRVHALLPPSMLVHFVRHAGKSLVLRILGLWAALRNSGPSTQKGTISPFSLVLSTYFALVGFESLLR
jgi:hypothetical protein